MPLIVIGVVLGLLWLIGRGQPASNAADESESESGSWGGSDSLSAFVEAWANAEGWNQPGSLEQRINNPVAIKGTWPGTIGHTASGFSIFDTPESGFAAAESWVSETASRNPGWSLRQLFAKVLGDLSGNQVNNAQGNSDQEAANVANYLGISPDQNVEQFLEQ